MTNRKPQAFRLTRNLKPVFGGYSAIPGPHSVWIETATGKVVSRQAKTTDTKSKGKKNPLS